MPSWKKVITSGSSAALSSLTVTNGATVSSSLALSGSINNVDYIDFNTGSATPAYRNGRVFWNDTEGALSVYNSEADVTLQVGQENWTRVYNDSGATIANGAPVRIIGTHGDHPEVVLAQSIQVSGSSNLVNQILGLATHAIEDQTFGYVTTQGLVRGLNTSAYSDGDTLYLSSSAGQLTSTVPGAPYEIVPVGQVVKAGPGGSGIIYVAVQQPLDFTDLSSVYLGLGTYQDGDIWTYNGPQKRWEHKKQLSGSYGLTGSINIIGGGITGSLFGTSSWAVNSANAQTASYVVTALTSSFVTASNVYGPFGSNSITSASFAISSSRTVSSSFASTASFVTTAQTASYVLQAVSASFASTASFVNTLTQNLLITGSLTVGSSSLGASENTITLGARDAASEGGQIGFNAPGGTYTSASFIDNWQNKARILKGNNTTSTGLIAQWDIHTTQMNLPAYTAASSFPGTATANLAVDSGGNVITVSTTGGTVFPYTGNAVITGSLTTTGIIYAQPNGGKYFQGGDDAALYDINVSNHMGIYGVQTVTEGAIKLGSEGSTLYGSGSKLGINTTNPSSASLTVNGNVWATSLTGSLLGTSSWANNVISSSYSLTASAAPLYLPLAGGTMTGDIYAAGRTFQFQDLVLGVGTTQGTIKTDGTKYIGMFPTNAVESTRFLANGNVMHGTTFTDTGYRLQVSSSSAVSGALQVIGTSVLSGSVNISASLSVGISTITAARIAASSAGANAVFTQATGSFTGAKYLYTVTSASNARTGEVLAVWNGTSVQYTDNSTLDIGSTTAVTASVSIVTSQAQFNMQTSNSGWTIKSQVTYL